MTVSKETIFARAREGQLWAGHLIPGHPQATARLDNTTSPLVGSRWMYTSSPSNRNSAGRRTAWLPPLVKSLAVLVMTHATLHRVAPSIYPCIDF